MREEFVGKGDRRLTSGPGLRQRLAVYLMNRVVPPETRHVFWFQQPDIAYFRIAKAANSSIRTLLAQSFGVRAEPGIYPGNNEFWMHQPQVSNLTCGAYARRSDRSATLSFSFVRHPAARLYSCWNNKVIDNPVLGRSFQKMGVVRGMDFDDFVARVAVTSDRHIDVHALSQSSVLTWRGSLLPRFVGRVETVERDWESLRTRILEKTGTDTGPLLKRNIRMKVGPEIMDALTPKTRDLIRKRYNDDFRLFYPDD